MTDDEVLEQVWAAKEALAQQFNYDVQAIGAYLREQRRLNDRPVVRRSPRRPPGWVEPAEEAGFEIDPIAPTGSLPDA